MEEVELAWRKENSLDIRECNLISEGFPWRRRLICGSRGQTLDLEEIRDGQLSTQSKETFQTGRTARMWIGCGFPVTGSAWPGQCGLLEGRLKKVFKHWRGAWKR